MFDTNVFSSPLTLLLGALTGLVFGFLLHRGRVARFETIVGQFRLTDFTVLKVMGTAIVVGGIGIWTLHALGLAAFHIKATHVLGQALGGVIFGTGMVLLGYCPGTAFVALGAGAKGALPGIGGMLAGAALYAETYAFWKPRVLEPMSYGKTTLPGATGIPGLVWLALLAVGFAILFAWLDRRRSPTAPAT